MFDELYINVFYWFIAAASMLAWARFAVWLGRDVYDEMPKQNDVLWKVLALAVLLLLPLIWVLMPNFWLGLVVNILLAGGLIGAYWAVRVKELGSRGHLFRSALQGLGSASARLEQRRNARAVTLAYLRADDSPLPLPGKDDPLQAGLAYADEMISKSLERNAENIEVTPGPSGYDVKFIVDGVAFPQPPMPRNVGDALIQAAKHIAKLSIEERRRPQEGAFKVRDADGNITRWTTRTSGSTAGEKLSLAANESSRWEFTVDQLGFSPDQLEAVRGFAADTNGIVLVASPRQSGRTSTLYAFLRSHDAFTNAVHTLEGNPQTEIEGVTVHRFDGRSSDITYAKALSSVLLKDPNVVMSFQCPDSATAEAAARFAVEGHRVYLGMPAFDTMAALEIWLKLVPNRRLAVESLRAIVSQRLVRLLCPTCKTPYQPDENTLRKLNLPIGRNLQSFKENTEGITDAKGNKLPCPDCLNVGYRGRTGIFELFVLTDEMRKAILDGASLKQVQAAARKNNMTLLVEHGIRKFASGITSIKEVLRVVQVEKGPNPSSASGVMPSQK